MNSRLSTECVSTTSATCAVYADTVELQRVVQALNQAGFPDEDICLVLAQAHPLAGLVRSLKLLSAETSHTALSGLMDWLFRLGAVVIPQVGIFVRSRDFLRALLVEPKTFTCLGNAGTFLNLHIPEVHARRFEGMMSDGGGLVYVNCRQVARARWATEILRGAGAKESYCLPESGALSMGVTQRHPAAQRLAAS